MQVCSRGSVNGQLRCSINVDRAPYESKSPAATHFEAFAHDTPVSALFRAPVGVPAAVIVQRPDANVLTST